MNVNDSLKEAGLSDNQIKVVNDLNNDMTMSSNQKSILLASTMHMYVVTNKLDVMDKKIDKLLKIWDK